MTDGNYQSSKYQYQIAILAWSRLCQTQNHFKFRPRCCTFLSVEYTLFLFDKTKIQFYCILVTVIFLKTLSQISFTFYLFFGTSAVFNSAIVPDISIPEHNSRGGNYCLRCRPLSEEITKDDTSVFIPSPDKKVNGMQMIFVWNLFLFLTISTFDVFFDAKLISEIGIAAKMSLRLFFVFSILFPTEVSVRRHLTVKFIL